MRELRSHSYSQVSPSVCLETLCNVYTHLWTSLSLTVQSPYLLPWLSAHLSGKQIVFVQSVCLLVYPYLRPSD